MVSSNHRNLLEPEDLMVEAVHNSKVDYPKKQPERVNKQEIKSKSIAQCLPGYFKQHQNGHSNPSTCQEAS